MKLKNEEFFNRELQDSEIEEIENVDYETVLDSFRFIKGDMYDYASTNISQAQTKMKKYYDIRHSRKFDFKKGDKVLKMVCKNIGRKGGKQDAKFTGPYVITSISDLGVAKLKTDRGCDLKTGVPVKQLQKYNEKNAEEENIQQNESDESVEDIKPPLKRRQLFPDGDEDSDADDFNMSPNIISGCKKQSVSRPTVMDQL